MQSKQHVNLFINTHTSKMLYSLSRTRIRIRIRWKMRERRKKNERERERENKTEKPSKPVRVYRVKALEKIISQLNE